MKKMLIWVSMGILAISVITAVGCSKDEEVDDFYNLDVEFRIPMTRSAQMDWEDGGASQTIGGSNIPYNTVPTYDNECMLWAIVNIALTKGQGTVTIKGDNGENKKMKISTSYTASNYYDYVKGIAIGQDYSVLGDNGESVNKTYQGGAMPSSIGIETARQAGIMEGVVRRFFSYNELYNYITDPIWKANHPDGTYMISNVTKQHASVCTGTSKSGNIKLKVNYSSDAPQDRKYTSKDNANDEYELMY